ncbi:energy-coupling factor transporter transmembrane component T [Flexilinea flocculi]|nr:energy-coupling factor transporter transmembrane component T [Flexilinea flocculi]
MAKTQIHRLNSLSNFPEWLSTTENYSPQKDSDTFINKSILSLLHILSKIKRQDSSCDQKYQIQPVLKVICTFLMVVLLSFSQNFVFVMIVSVYSLCLLSLMEANRILSILKISFWVSLFTFIILLPANRYSVMMITMKVFATVTMINILSHSTKWSAITGSFKFFHVPDLFILVLDITIKYIMMLGNYALQLIYALKLRSVGKNRNKYQSLSGVAGNLFIKSVEMSKEMYDAMECRGFNGKYRTVEKRSLLFIDYFYITIHIGILILFHYFG